MVKIQKRTFDASDEEVVAEILSITMSLKLGGIDPTLTKIKQDLKCSEADLIPIIKRSEILWLKQSGPNQVSVWLNSRFFPELSSKPEAITADFIQEVVLKVKEKEKIAREQSADQARESKD